MHISTTYRHSAKGPRSKLPKLNTATSNPLVPLPSRLHQLRSASPRPNFGFPNTCLSLANSLRDFGPALLAKYQPKGSALFSAHWETQGEYLVTDYGEKNPLPMDYYNFDPEFHKLRFSSRGDATLSKRVVELFQNAGIRARLTTMDETRGIDGHGFEGPGLDHGVFVAFSLMFDEEFRSVPIVQASIDGSLSPEGNWALGEAITSLRKEGVLILSGGLIVHNLRNPQSFVRETADPPVVQFNDAVNSGIFVADADTRKTAPVALTQHDGFSVGTSTRRPFCAHLAAGAGENGGVHVLSGLYECQAVAF